jgi:hypothetical protein
LSPDDGVSEGKKENIFNGGRQRAKIGLAVMSGGSEAARAALRNSFVEPQLASSH